MAKVNCEHMIKEHKVSQLGTPEISETIDLPIWPDGYDKPEMVLSGFLTVRNQGDLLFHVGDKIRVTIETIPQPSE